MHAENQPLIRPAHGTGLTALKEHAESCRACPLYRDATQTVFGEGPRDAQLFLVGEQPGDREDLEGRPFVGPAGKLLDRALQDAGISRNETYITNAVKHFKFIWQGKRRLHKKPSAREIAACRPWLEAELEAIRPRVLLCLGATAAHVLVGRSVRILRDRGKPFASDACPITLVTIHPSALLRTPDEKSREENYRAFVRDLRVAARLFAKRPKRRAKEIKEVWAGS